MASQGARSQFVMKLNALLLTGLLLLVGMLAPGVHTMTCGRNIVTPKHCSSMYDNTPVAKAEPFLTAANTEFGSLIEAAAVDESGSIFATDYFGLTSTLGRVSNNDNSVHQQVFYNGTSSSSTNPYFNGLRFLPGKLPSSPSGEAVVGRRALAADVNGRSVFLLSTEGEGRVSSTVFCHDSAMVQPNDIAIAPRAGRVYTSGQNYTSDTFIGDGDLWMCSGTRGFDMRPGGHPVVATRLGLFGRTNGIEVSPDEKTLYLSEAFNRQGNVVSNKVWRFEIDQWTGHVWNQTLFVDFEQLDGSGSVDVDGMRTDVKGNLYVTRNGGGEVVKFSPGGEVLLRIQLLSIQNPTNLELGGEYGTTLFVVGQCADTDQDKGCVDVWHGNSIPGRAFRDLNSVR